MDSEQRLQVVNNSEIPIRVSWRTYNKSEKKNRPFEAVYDTSTSDDPDQWSFRIDRFHGLESPRYFTVRQCRKHSLTLYRSVKNNAWHVEFKADIFVDFSHSCQRKVGLEISNAR